MVATLSGRWFALLFCSFSFQFLVLGIFFIIVKLTRIYDQGGAFALLQRIPSVTEHQIELPHAGHCTLDTSHNSTTSRRSEGLSSQVDGAGALREEGRLS